MVTNECTTAKRLLAEKLNRFGYDCVTPANIISPAPAACEYLLKMGYRPRLHVWDGVLEDFKLVLDKYASEINLEKSWQPDCLVVGDVMGKLNREFVDESLEIMLNCTSKKPSIVSLGAGRYYKDSGKLRMDTGAYVKAFEYCLDVQAYNIGKPSEEFFKQALNVVKGCPDDTIMIGDDVISDVGGAQQMKMRGFLVRTGKYKPIDETGARGGLKPDDVFDNLAEAVDKILSARKSQ